MAKNIRTMRVRTLTAKKLEVGHIVRHDHHHEAKKLHELRRKLRHLRHELKEDNRELRRLERIFAGRVATLQGEIAALRRVVESGLAPNPALQATFTARIGQTVTVTTPAGAVSGTVIAAGTDAVELREASGDVVVIPYAKITAVQ
ncbi:MAG: hypothetical protein K6T78_00765 [Alicyclobacillus sp.]|nr:hypothetical protein [Alicyclobacillus sp.]